MKTLSCFLVTVLFCGCKSDDFTIGCLPSNLQEGLLAFYPFRAGAPLDATVTGNDLAYSGSVYVNDCSIGFLSKQGRNSSLITSNSSFLDGLTEYSISLKYRPEGQILMRGTIEGLISRGSRFECPDRIGNWSISLTDCRQAVFSHNNSVRVNSLVPGNCAENFKEVTGIWQHVVATRSGDVHRIYYNGELQEEIIGNADCTDLRLSEDEGDLFIGQGFNGLIDDVLIYNRELTVEDVMVLYELENCCE